MLSYIDMLSLPQGRLQGRRLRGSILSVAMHMSHTHALTRARARARRHRHGHTAARRSRGGGQAFDERLASSLWDEVLSVSRCPSCERGALAAGARPLPGAAHGSAHEQLRRFRGRGATRARNSTASRGAGRRRATQRSTERPRGPLSGPRNDADAGGDCDSTPPKRV